MADLKIYNNGENKILMSAGDRIIRQPYEFGRAFQNSVGLNNYIQITGLNISESEFSILNWCNQPTLSYNSSIRQGYIVAFNDLGKYYQLQYDPSPGLKRQEFMTYYSSQVAGGAFYNGVNLVYLRSSKINYSSRGSYRSGDNNFATTTESNILTKIWIGRPYINQNYYFSPQVSQNRYVVYNRFVSDSEMLYYFSNRIGSDLQINDGIYIDLHNDFAEILDFSILQDGSDMRVGCRDYSGNNHHGEIMNLPAGTLQEQLDWANANLFVPFIS